MKSRRQRRQEAREQGVPFEPQYQPEKRWMTKHGEFVSGGSPKTHEEMFGVGYERYDDKYTKVSSEIGGR